MDSVITLQGKALHVPLTCNRGHGEDTQSALAALAKLDPKVLVELGPGGYGALHTICTRAPGTFFHVLHVAELMPKEFQTPEYVAATLLHDVGKLVDPGSFAENRVGESSRPDAHVLLSHVQGGNLLADYYRLGPLARQAILEHHGTLPISTALSYCGPAPQSIYTATLMMVDTLEALRSSNAWNAAYLNCLYSERQDLNQFRGVDIGHLNDIVQRILFT